MFGVSLKPFESQRFPADGFNGASNHFKSHWTPNHWASLSMALDDICVFPTWHPSVDAHPMGRTVGDSHTTFLARDLQTCAENGGNVGHLGAMIAIIWHGWGFLLFLHELLLETGGASSCSMKSSIKNGDVVLNYIEYIYIYVLNWWKNMVLNPKSKGIPTIHSSPLLGTRCCFRSLMAGATSAGVNLYPFPSSAWRFPAYCSRNCCRISSKAAYLDVLAAVWWLPW